MSDKSTAEKERRGEATDVTVEAVIAAERQRCIDRVLTYAALRDQAAMHRWNRIRRDALGGGHG
jgi:hypothetical protein